MTSDAWAKLFRFLLIAGGIFAVASASEKMITSPLAHGDMESYIHGAQCILAGQDIYATPSRPPEQGGLYYIYPPLLAVLFIPLALLPVSAAIVIWSVVNLLLFIWIVRTFYEAMTGTSLSELCFNERWTLVFWALVPPSRFVLHHFFYGQANILILAITVFGLKHLGRSRPVVGGLAVGLAVAIKVMTFPLGLIYLLKRNGRAVSGIIGGTIAGLLLPAMVLGLDTNFRYLAFWLRNIALSASVNTSTKVPLYVNVSLQAQLYRFFGGVPGFTFRGAPHEVTIVRLPDSFLHTVEVLLPAVMLIVIGVYVYRFRNADELVSHWGAITLALSLIAVFTPFAQKHYLVLLVPAFLFLTHVWYRIGLRDPWFRGLVVASAALLILTNEAICGEYLGGVFAGTGMVAGGTLLACAAIFRAASKYRSFTERASESIPTPC